MSQYIYSFGSGKAEGLKLGKYVLGGKGANLTKMAHLGIPVPPGIIISTEVSKNYTKTAKLSSALKQELKTKIGQLEKSLGRTLGGSRKPLLVSVRSGAPVSMPGMMDTVLNLGLNQESLEGLAEDTKNQHFAFDSYRRFIQMFGDVVLGIGHSEFEEILEKHKKDSNVKEDFELSTDTLGNIITAYKQLVQQRTGHPFPEDVYEQLFQAVEAVFGSWHNGRAVYYRNLNDIPHDLGTAVTIQSMVFGNMGNDSGTGVAFTRNPSTGEKVFFGEYLLNAQGEDVVAGIRTPKNIQNLAKEMPEMYKQLDEIQHSLEEHFGDMQDLEFTIQQNKLFILQTRNGKRTGTAALRIAMDMVAEDRIDKKTALTKIDPAMLPSLLAPIFLEAPKAEAIATGRRMAKGLNAGPGATSGKIVFDSITALKWASQGEAVILVRQETSPEDIMGMQNAAGVLTARGGMTSHAAVVARGMNKPCVVGCTALQIDHKADAMQVQTNTKNFLFHEGDIISIDGTTGEVFSGALETQESEIERFLSGKSDKKTELTEHFLTLMKWADEYRTLQIRANADSPQDAKIARKYGAQGIGLCRTEHMFFEKQRILVMRQMILATNKEERQSALDELLKYQQEDFRSLFEVMDGLPVTVRLLDPPLHEFLPDSPKQYQELSRHLKLDVDEVRRRAGLLREENPMLGHRGCRLGITFPEITHMQVRALIQAALTVKKQGKKVYPEIMVPLVSHPNEMQEQRLVIESAAQEVMQELGESIPYAIGSMIEIPVAALQADKIANHADFFSFGTNDLTQMSWGISRDDAEGFLNQYIDLGIYDNNPFQTLDTTGVGELIKIAMKRACKTRTKLKFGICGEHGGDAKSIQFFHQQGLEYVSCSPFRIAAAKLAAARAALSC